MTPTTKTRVRAKRRHRHALDVVDAGRLVLFDALEREFPGEFPGSVYVKSLPISRQ